MTIEIAKDLFKTYKASTKDVIVIGNCAVNECGDLLLKNRLLDEYALRDCKNDISKVIEWYLWAIVKDPMWSGIKKDKFNNAAFTDFVMAFLLALSRANKIGKSYEQRIIKQIDLTNGK